MSQQPMYHGSLYWITTAVTETVTDTPIKAAGATNASNCFGFSHSDNRLTYDGAVARTFLINVSFAISASGATNSTMHLAKNGEPVVSGIQRKIGTGGDIGAAAVGVLIKMSKDDYVELWVETDDGDDLTVENCIMTATVAG